LESNPELLAKAVRRRIESVLDNTSDGNGVSDLLGQLRNLRELEDEVGGGKKLGGFVDSSLISEVVKILPAFLGKSMPQLPPTSPQPPPEQTEIYIIKMLDGEELRLTPAQFSEYQRRQALPSGSQNGPEEQVQEETQEEEVQEEEPGSSSSVGLRITDWEPYLDQDPSVFVSALSEMIEQEDPSALLARNLLAQKSADEVLEMILPYRTHEEIGPVIQKIEARPEWLAEVVRLVQGGGVDNHGV